MLLSHTKTGKGGREKMWPPFSGLTRVCLVVVSLAGGIGRAIKGTKERHVAKKGSESWGIAPVLHAGEGTVTNRGLEVRQPDF